ncbi:MAG: DUF2058 domain-containing protein [Gammaproteobacteria bacterium]|nr:DUF2058 domain-containing protein [Gammaproteobacteria bacterium]
MGNSLFDALQKSGLVDKDKAKKAKRSQYKNQKQKGKKGQTNAVDESRRLAQQAQAEKVERDRQLNQQRKEAADRKAIGAQIKQLIEMNRIDERDGDVVYNFTDDGKIKSLYVNDAIHRQLGRGQLTIVRFVERYELVPTVVADKIKERDESYIVACDRSQSDDASAQDDPYADYKVPDDLMW